jgi:hypothetical protein
MFEGTLKTPSDNNGLQRSDSQFCLFLTALSSKLTVLSIIVTRRQLREGASQTSMCNNDRITTEWRCLGLLDSNSWDAEFSDKCLPRNVLAWFDHLIWFSMDSNFRYKCCREWFTKRFHNLHRCSLFLHDYLLDTACYRVQRQTHFRAKSFDLVLIDAILENPPSELSSKDSSLFKRRQR